MTSTTITHHEVPARTIPSGSRIGTGKRSIMKVCHHCNGSIIRVHRKGFGQYLISVWGIYPFACTKCRNTAFRPQSGQMGAAALVTALALILAGTGAYYGVRAYQGTEHRLRRVLAAQNKASSIPETPVVSRAGAIPGFLTNADVIRLSKARMSSRTLIDLIRRGSHDFQVDPESLVALKDGGTSEQVIMVMVEATIPKPPGTIPPSPDHTRVATTH
jgi:hypothetical protein